ncbi:uncharacterized protein [Ptychodera flava]|uniref:uncharacterized protein n=1 Tax=Ptychodera flava TaxID=63121 RepID=UPI00396A3EA1
MLSGENDEDSNDKLDTVSDGPSCDTSVAVARSIGNGCTSQANSEMKDVASLSPLEKLDNWRKLMVQDNERPPTIYYNRDSQFPFRQLVSIYKRGINLRVHPTITFISGGEEEPAVDAGGPSREFFILL